MANSELTAVIRAIDATTPGVSSAKANLGSLQAAVSGMASGIATGLTGALGGFLALDKAIGLTFAGIRNASAVRDLQLQMESLEGSTAEAARTLAFFDDAQERTRRTGSDLAKVYGELLPMALAKGFSREGFQDVVVQLDQIATRTGQLPEEINSAFAKILSGNPGKANPILRALGLDPDSVRSGQVSADELLAQMRRLASEGEAMGDTFDSAAHKIQDSIADAFAKGWNSAEASTKGGVEQIRKDFESVSEYAEKAGSSIRTLAGWWLKFDAAVVGAADSGHKAIMQFADWQGDLMGIDRPKAYSPTSRDYGTQFGQNRPGPVALISDEELARRQRAIESDNKAAEAAKKLREEIEKRVESIRFEIQLLQAGDPFQKAEVTYMRDMAAATREATKQLRGLAEERADIIREQSISSAFGSLNRDILGGMMDRAPGIAVPDNSQQLARLQWELDIAEKRGALEDRISEARTEREIEAFRQAHDQFGARFGDTLADFAISGGENFGDIAGRRFSEMVTAGADDIFGAIFGHLGDSTKDAFDASGKKIGQQAPGQLYDSKGRLLSPAAQQRAQSASMAFDFAAMGVSSYNAGKSGAEGSQTAGLISGAISGAAMGAGVMSIVTGIIGAAVGWGTAALGKSAAREDYQFGIPRIDTKGRASMGRIDDINDAEASKMISEIQDTYDSFRNSYVKMLLKIPESIIPKIEAIDGQFQSKASKNFMKHFDEWISGTLPDQIAKQFQGSMKTVFTAVGLEAERFDQLWKQFDALDPHKTAQLWGELLESMVSMSESREILTRGGGRGVEAEWYEMRRRPEEVLQEDFFNRLMEMGRGLDDLVGEDQIHQLQEIARLQEQGAAAVKSAWQEIARLADAALLKTARNLDSLELMGMVKEDGTPDYAAQGEFLRGRADQQLTKLQTANNAQEVDAAYDEFLNLINQIVASGYQIDAATGEEWRKWAITQIQMGGNLVQSEYAEIGERIGEASQKYVDDFKPYLDGFTSVVTDVGTGLGGFRDVIEETIPPIERFRDVVGNAVTQISGAIEKLDTFTLATAAGRAA